MSTEAVDPVEFRAVLEVTHTALDDVGAWVTDVAGRYRALVDDLKAQGIHVGTGVPPRCVTCDEPWPCAPSRTKGAT